MIFFGYGFELLYHMAVLIIHEFSHAEMAKRRGFRLNGIKLMPYGAALSAELENMTPRDEIYIALAGPVINLLMAGIFVCIWWLFPNSYPFTQNFVRINLITATFNLLPLYPLDGGRVLLAALSLKFKRQNVYKVMRWVGLAAAGVFAAFSFTVFYLTANVSLALIAVFFFASTLLGEKNSSYQRLYSMAYRSQKLKKGMLVREIIVGEDASILSLLRMINANYFYRFNVVDASFNPIKQITELDLEALAAQKGSHLSLGMALSCR